MRGRLRPLWCKEERKETMRVENLCSVDNQFYPTPKKIVREMVRKLDPNAKIFLEPSAGKGDIADEILRVYSRREIELEMCEKDPDLYHLLSGKYSEETKKEIRSKIWELNGRSNVWNSAIREYENTLSDAEKKELEALEKKKRSLDHASIRMVGRDFLAFHTATKFDAIVMNPPFAEGEKHLLHALELIKDGGQVVCLLNAQTLRNLCTNARRILVKKLAELNAKITFENAAFSDAERTTDVEIALINVKIPKEVNADASFILQGLKKAEKIEVNDAPSQDAVAKSDPIDRAVEQYNFEINAGLQLYREYEAISACTKTQVELQVCGDAFEPNTFVKNVRRVYWESFFKNDEFRGRLTSNLADTFADLVEDAAKYEFCRENIDLILHKMAPLMENALESTIDSLFETLTCEHSWYPECQNNIHYYNGWAHNKAHMVNTSKVILPMGGCFAGEWRSELLDEYHICNHLRDIEKTLDYIACNSTDSFVPYRIEDKIKEANILCSSKNIQLKYFKITFYKKGTCHISWNEETKPLIEKLNILAAKSRCWLPPSYGKKTYDEMTPQEQEVINAFHGGRKGYDKVLQKKDFYLGSSSPMLLAM